MCIFISTISISSPNSMFDHLLESSHRDDSNKWSNIEFGEEITQLESIEVHFTMHFIWSSGELWYWYTVKTYTAAIQQIFNSILRFLHANSLIFNVFLRFPVFTICLNRWNRPGCFRGRVSTCRTGGPEFNSWGRVIPKTLKMVAMASLLRKYRG